MNSIGSLPASLLATRRLQLSAIYLQIRRLRIIWADLHF